MKFLNYILNGFSRVLSVDAEFLLDSTGTSPQRVLCLVFKDIQTGEIFRHWVDGKSHVPHFFDYESCLLVSFNAVAEHGVFLNLLHGQPKYMVDCFVENKCLYGPFISKNKTGLIDTCARYNIDTILFGGWSQSNRIGILRPHSGPLKTHLEYNLKTSFTVSSCLIFFLFHTIFI